MVYYDKPAWLQFIGIDLHCQVPRPQKNSV